MSPIVFLLPSALALLVLLPLLRWFPRRARDVRHLLLRALLLALGIIALSQPVVLRDDTTVYSIWVIDLSESASVEARVAAERFVATEVPRLAPRARTGCVLIGAAAASTLSAFDRVVRLDESGETSPLSRALHAALRLIPEHAPGSITLLSDGQATERDWGRALIALEERGLPLHTIPLTARRDTLAITNVEWSEPLRIGATARLAVTVRGGPANITVALVGPNGLLATSPQVEASGVTHVPLEFEPTAAGFLPVTLEIRLGDNAAPNSISRSTTLAICDPLRALYVTTRVRGGGPQLATIVGRGITIEACAPSALATRLASPIEFELLILDDCSADELAPAVQQEIVGAVRDHGLGLFFAGGAASFGPGGYHETPIEEIVPVEFVQKEEKKDPSTALALIIDTSGSMGGNRIRLAKEVARLAIRRLLPHDKIGIVEFYGHKRWAAPLQSAANAIEIQRALNRLDAGGGTILLPAIEEAYYGLRNVETRYKHVLVLTDAGVENGAYEDLFRRMVQDGICVSTVLVGPGRHSEFLVQLADWGNGRFYTAADRFQLPEVILKQPSTSRLPAYRSDETAVRARGGSAWWADFETTGIPPLAGYVETRTRAGATTILETEREAAPIIASWCYGLGRVTAITTELTGPGTEPWREWSSYAPLVARLIERTANDASEPFRYEWTRDARELRLTARRNWPHEFEPHGDVIDEFGRATEPLVFHTRADGAFTAAMSAIPATDVRWQLDARRRLVAPGAESRAHELAVDASRTLDLARAAAATGGYAAASLTTVDTAQMVTKGGGDRVQFFDLRPLVIALALLMYGFDLAYRRRKTSAAEGSA
ncbi:MAG: VWA domain-containing protein [Planctomycetota bacterium]